jgi:hypothetical protein
MTRLLALAAAITACAVLPSAAFAAAQGTESALWRFDELTGATELVANPGFESNASGYDHAAGYFTAAASSLVRDTSSAHSGSASGAVTVPGSAAYEGGRYRITYPFKAGVRYAFSVWVRSASATNNVNAALGIGSDNAGGSNGPLALSTTWKRITGTWTPTADRSSADLGVYLPAAAGSAKTFQVDDVSVAEADLVGNPGFESDASGYDHAAGYFTNAATSFNRDTTSAHSGSASGALTVPGSVAYEGGRYRITYPFKAGVRYTFSVWVRSASATSNVNAALGIGSHNAGASNGPLALSTTWQRLSGAWTPNADSSSADLGVYLPAAAGSARTFQVDDVSVQVPPFKAKDARGANDGTYAGGYTLGHTGATSDGGTAVQLDGANGRITTAYNPFAPGAARTFAGWAKRSTSGTDDALLAGDASVGYPVLRALAGGNSVRFNPNTTGAGQDFTNALPGTGVWFHWALVWDDATREATLYVDGVNKGTKTFSFGLASSPGNLELGAEGGTTNPFNGYLDDVAVYDYRLTETEVRQLLGLAPDCGQTLSPGDDVADAVESAAAGSVVCLSPGTYTSPGTNNSFPSIDSGNGTAAAPVILTSEDPSDPALLSGRLWTRSTVSHLEISHLKFTWNAPDENTILLTGSRVILEHNDISGAGETICVATGNATTTDAVIDRNKIHDCGDPDDSSDRIHAQGVYTNPGTSNLRVSNNWCYRVAARCYQERYGQNDVWIRNVADYENWGFIFGDGNPAPSGNSMTLNISGPHHYEYASSGYGKGGDLVEDLVYGGSGNTFTNNCWGGVAYRNHPSSSSLTISNNTVATPQFVDAANGDFRQTANSPCQGFGPTGSLPGP